MKLFQIKVKVLNKDNDIVYFPLKAENYIDATNKFMAAYNNSIYVEYDKEILEMISSDSNRTNLIDEVMNDNICPDCVYYVSNEHRFKVKQCDKCKKENGLEMIANSILAVRALTLSYVTLSKVAKESNRNIRSGMTIEEMRENMEALAKIFKTV